MRVETPIYKAIALDIAQRIVNAEFTEGMKLSGRSLLAGRYNVSPETVRRAVALLREARVVEVSQGKEVLVTSVESAYRFIERYKKAKSVSSLRQDVERLIADKRALDGQLERVMEDIIDYSDRLRNLTPYNPVELVVPQHSHVCGHTVNELRFWQHTGATIVAIRRGGTTMISPGPDALIHAFDRIVLVGGCDVVERASNFIAWRGKGNTQPETS